jgi:putative membrane protein
MITTSSSNVSANFRANRLQQILLVSYALVWIWAAINPVFPFDWFLENLLTVLVVAFLLVTHRRFPLSDLSYILIFLFLCLHAVGGHYTYAHVPLGFWLQETLDLSRNHYDRIVHFSFGLLLAYPLREAGLRFSSTSRTFATLAALGFIFTGSASFEIIEMVVVMIVDPQAGQAYMGTQGDEWDGQKDMALAALGASIALSLSAWLDPKSG